jgi:DUF1680 family protein
MVFLTAAGMFGQQSQIKTFKLKDVRLENGPFRNAMLVDLNYILELDPDKLLAPFLREAGLEPKASSYPNWENSGLDGHIGGHYLTALAQMYASAGSEEALDRLEYMFRELKRAQDAYGTGYIGGVPGSKELWEEIAAGKVDAGSFSLNGRWVPLYNIHKTYAGLLDAYQITGSELAKEMLIGFTDWMIRTTENLSKEQIQTMLRSEYGGLNEVFAGVYRIIGEQKYLDLAYNFSQKALLDPLSEEKDELNGMHANTQIPKVVVFKPLRHLQGMKNIRTPPNISGKM